MTVIFHCLSIESKAQLIRAPEGSVSVGLVRPSNKHILIVRVLQARRAPDRLTFISPPSSLNPPHAGGLVDPQLRASNDINAPSKLACSLSGMGAD